MKFYELMNFLLILQQKKPNDFVISTGKQTTVKNFVNLVAKYLKIKIKWTGKGIKEKAIDENGNVIVACDKAYYRPLEVNSLLGSSKKARRILGWKPQIKINELTKLAFAICAISFGISNSTFW